MTSLPTRFDVGGERLSAWLKQLQSEPGRWPYVAAMTACLVLGFWLRARGFLYDVPAMGLDESSWGMMLVDLPLTELLIRPPGFMAVSKVFAWLFGPTETALRTLPWLGGLAALAFSPFIARRLFAADSARLLFVAVIATNPALTDLTKEFKPYSISVALHMAVAFLALRYLQERKGRDLAWLLGVSAGGVLFAQDLVFAYPGVFALIGASALKHDRRRLPLIAGAALVIIVALLLQYFLIWSYLPKGEADYWGDKYNVFFVPSSGRSYLEWLAGRYEKLVAFPAFHARFWSTEWFPGAETLSFRAIADDVWFLLHLLGLSVLLLRRRYREFVLLVAPLVSLAVFNRLGFWPLGVFRTNTFLIAYLGAIAASVLDRTLARRSLWDVVPASVLVLVPLFLFEGSWPPATKRAFSHTSQFPELLEWLATVERKPSAPREVIVLAHGICEPWHFYMEYHPATAHLRGPINERYDARCLEDPFVLDELRRATSSGPPTAWLIRAKNPPFGRQPYLRRLETVRFDRHVLVHWESKSESPGEGDQARKKKRQKKSKRSRKAP